MMGYNVKEKEFDFSVFLEKVKDKIERINLNDAFHYFRLLYPERKLFLLLDEFQELSSTENIGFIRELRTAIDFNHDYVKVIFTGSSYNKLMSFFNDYSQPFYNFGFHLTLNDFGDEFIDYLLSTYFENTQNLNITKDCIKEHFEKTGRSPFYVSEALKILQNKITKDAINEDFENEVNKLLVLDQELLEKELIHLNFWNKISFVEKYILLRIIRFGGKLMNKGSLGNLSYLLKIEDESKIKTKISYATKKLIKSEKIIKDKGEFKIVDLKLKEWIINSSAFSEIYLF